MKFIVTVARTRRHDWWVEAPSAEAAIARAFELDALGGKPAKVRMPIFNASVVEVMLEEDLADEKAKTP